MLKEINMEQFLTKVLKEEWEKRQPGRPPDTAWINNGLKSIKRNPELHGKVLYRVLEMVSGGT